MIIVKEWWFNNKFESRRELINSFIKRYGSYWIEREIRLVSNGLVREVYVEIVGSWNKRKIKILNVDIGNMKFRDYLNSSFRE